MREDRAVLVPAAPGTDTIFDDERLLEITKCDAREGRRALTHPLFGPALDRWFEGKRDERPLTAIEATTCPMLLALAAHRPEEGTPDALRHRGPSAFIPVKHPCRANVSSNAIQQR